MATLLLDTTSPAYVGGVFGVLEAPEIFGRFEEAFATGERMWWDDTSPEWIAAVTGTGTPFYTRLVPGGLDRVPGVAEALAAGCASSTPPAAPGIGLVRLATTYPTCTIVGVDGDEHSIDRGTGAAGRGRPRRPGGAGAAARWRTWSSTSRHGSSSTTSPCTSAATSTGSPRTCARRWSPAAGS